MKPTCRLAMTWMTMACAAAAVAQTTAPVTQPEAPSTAPAARAYEELYLNNGRLVFSLRMDQDWSAAWPVWSWTAVQSEGQIAVRHRAWFTSTDDCKPVLGGTHVLISSSRGGVALVRRADGACAWYAPCTNAHSAELVGDRWIAAASSVRGNEVQVFDRQARTLPAEKLAAIPLAGAHGLVYDWRQDVLWALGTTELLKTRIVEGGQGVRIEVLKRFALPAEGGHDLFPYFHYKQENLPAGQLPQTAKGLFVTVYEGVYVFDLTTETFVPFAPLAKVSDVKSVTDNLRTGRIVYNRAEGDTSLSQRVSFLQPDQVRALPARIGSYQTRIYKVRWIQPNPFSYRQDAEGTAGQ